MNEFIMADGSIEIKTEPLDVDEPAAIKFEELIIKTEYDNNFHTEGEKNDELVTVKQEPLEDELYLIQLEQAVQEPEQESNTPNFECDTCKRDFTSARALTVHKRLRCRNLNICNICGQVFRTRIILEDHLSQHQQKASKTTKTSPTLRRLLPKTPPKSSPEPVVYSCKSCQLTFADAQSLTSHNRIHEGFKHICNKCGKSFKYAAELKKHNSGDTCATEAIEDVLKYSQSDIKIKEEVVSEDEPSTQGTMDDQVQLDIGKSKSNQANDEHRSPLPPLVQLPVAECPVTVKTETLEEPVTVKEEPADSFDYEELILKELIDRKAKSIAKVKATQQQTHGKRQSEKEFTTITVDKTDFEEVIHSNMLALLPKAEKRISTDDDSNQHSSPDQEDFEDSIKSNTLPTSQNQSQIIQSLKEEYQKAKKKKLDESLTDDSSQHSSKTPNREIPSSLYFSVTEDPAPYNRAVRRLKATNNDYRYSWVCPSCPRRYIQRHGFIKHLTSTHSVNKDDLEGKLFELKPEITVFHLSTNNEETYCHLCRVTLADAASLKKHRNEFHKEGTTVQLPFKCDKCGKYCSTRSTLGDHVQANCGTEPQYGCPECGKKFYTKSTLNLHRTMHTGELPYKCFYCVKQFRTRGQMTVHTRTHTGEKPFPCKVCEKRFTHRETLIAHLSRHIDMKRYKCYGCQSFFSCISGLKTHRLTRMNTCGQFKLNARPVGPRVRVIKGNVIFEPQPKINPYSRRDNDDFPDDAKRNVLLQQNGQNLTEIENLYKKETISVDS